jgi:HlyD family secretion protein
VSIQVWKGKDVLRLPIGALFRQRHQWAVYRFDADGAVNLEPVEIGHVNNLEAKVTSGLSEMRSSFCIPLVASTRACG